MELNLKSKVALVTGAGSQAGQGKEIALTLAREGCDVIVNDIDGEGVEKTAADIEASGYKTMAVKADITESREVTEMVDKVLKEFGRIDILVNNAGGQAGGGPVAEMDEAKWDRTIDINLKGAMLCSRAVLPGMIARKYGKIVNMSSHPGKLGAPNGSSYAAACAGIFGFTKALAQEVGPSGINVNIILPGMIVTDFFKALPREKIQEFAERLPVRRAGTVQDAANLVAFLVSDVSGYITGQTIVCDGGSFMI